MGVFRETVWVQCPHCGKKRKTISTKSIKCFFCTKSFSVLKKDGTHRLTKPPRHKEPDFYTWK